MNDVDITHKLKALRAIAQALMDSIDDLVRVPVVPTGKRLVVPWLSQLGPNAAYAPGDCGAASVAMLINAVRDGQGITVDDVSRATGRPAGYKSTSFQELINAASHFGVMLEHAAPTLENIRADIDSGRPVIVIVNYKSLPQYSRYDASYNAGHYIVIVGYEDDCIFYHDSYWQEAARGAYRSLTNDDFMLAYTVIAPNNTRAPHALRMTA